MSLMCVCGSLLKSGTGIHHTHADCCQPRSPSRQICHSVNTQDVDVDLKNYQPRVGRAPVVNWYPGHIAKAERQLKEQLKLVDVVLEVRDARIPISTSHPEISSWIGEKPRLLLLNRKDMVSKADMDNWSHYFAQRNQEV